MFRVAAPFFSLALLALGLSSCGVNTAVVTLDYDPRLTQGINGPRVVGVGRFADMRREVGSTLGTIRLPWGAPSDKISTRIPVEQVVRNGFAYGLESRHMLAGREAPYLLAGEIYDLECQQLVHPTALARVRVNLVRSATGQIVFSRVYQAERQGGAYIPGSGSPVPQVNEMLSRALQNVIDRALDDQGFRANIRQ